MTAALKNLLLLRWNLYLTDFLDILIIALLIYSLFIFFRRTRSYVVFFGLAITIGLYILARSLNLYLTLTALRYFAGVSVVLFVIIFQSEIKKYFEFLGLIGTRQIKVGPLASKSPTSAEIIQATVKMAQAKIGSLIVIQGRDNLESFIEGGIDLDGVISEEILLSIFDPHSDGHDGALIISNNRILKFGTHLPLSTNFKEIGKHGTRHSAALGLAENTDALSIVSSEEKGKISICKDGKMKTLDQYSELEKELEKFIKSKFSSKTDRNAFKILHPHLELKLGALLFAAVIWFFTAYQAEIIERTYSVPLNIEKLSKDTIIEDYSPKEISITVSGRGNTIFSNVTSENFKVNFDASQLEGGTARNTISRKDIVVPANLSLISVEPISFLLTAKKYYIASVSVAPHIEGTTPEEITLSSVIVTPEKADVWVPVGEDPPTTLATESIKAEEYNKSSIIPVKLVIPENIRLVNSDPVVNVALTIEESVQ